jgi:DNA-binding response OmpR family regulator
VEIQVSKHKVCKAGKDLWLWNKEYLIIELLAINRWFPQSKVTLLEKVWWEQEENLNMNSTTLEAHISVLRKKVGKKFIKTIKWVGYVIEE